MGPSAIPMEVGPHPHIGLQTVTWLLDGRVLHRDSLGSEQLIRPGQLNLMTAGAGVAHSEEAAGDGMLEGAQLWIAQPSSTRHGPAAFEHHEALPEVGIAGGRAVVMVGSFLDATSPARHDSPLMGVELDVVSGELPLDPGWEYALIVLRGAAEVEGVHLQPGATGYLSPGRTSIAVKGPARLLLLGGEPFPEKVLMWWNFVARTPEEIESARTSWETGAGRFAPVGSPLERIAAPPLTNLVR
jgi:hypothetical protein